MSYSGVQPVYGTFPSDLFTGNGSNTVFTMSSVPGNDAALLVTVDGVRQHTDTYSYTANTLTFSEAPGSGAIIETVNMGSRADVIITEGVYKKTQFTATASQTNFTIATGYTVGFVDVYLNGIRLVVADDFTATDGTTIILAAAAASGDAVEVVAYGTFNVANALLKSGDTMSGNLVVSGTSTLMSPVAIANTTGNTFVIANTGAVTSSSNTLTVGTAAYFVANGNVGIGTNSPAEKIDVSMSGDLKLRLQTSNNTVGAGHSGIVLKTGSAEYTIQNLTTTQGSAGALRVYDGNSSTERMRIDASGRVTLPYQPSFRAYATTAQTPGSQVVIVFNNDSATNMFNIGSHYNTTNGRFTAPVTGVYVFQVSLLFSGMTAGQGGDTAIYKNGASIISFNRRRYTADATGYGSYLESSTTNILKLTAGDYITVVNDASSRVLYVNDPNWTHFAGWLLG